MKHLRIGVIGCYGRGGLADYAHQPENGVELVAGAERYEEPRRLFLKRIEKKGIPAPHVYEDYREMIDRENLDGVIVTTPDFLHEEHAVYALEHKVPVYLEKPIAISIESADRILEAAYRNRTKLVIGHNMRYMAFTRKMKETIDAGTIGEVSGLVPPFRQLRRRRLLPRLARREALFQQSSAAEGGARHRHHPLAGRRFHPAGQRNGRADRLRPGAAPGAGQ